MTSLVYSQMDLPWTLWCAVVEFCPTITEMVGIEGFAGEVDKIVAKRNKLIGERAKNRLLVDYGLDDSFWKCLTESHGVISGSFLVQSALGITWTESGLDIFVPETRSEPLFRYLCNTRGHPQRTCLRLHRTGICSLAQFDMIGHTVQLWEVSGVGSAREQICQWIRDNCDLTFLANTMDGDKSLRICFPLDLASRDGRHLLVNQEKDPAYKTKDNLLCYYPATKKNTNDTAHGIEVPYRCLKWSLRGFSIANYTLPDRVVLPLCQRPAGISSGVMRPSCA